MIRMRVMATKVHGNTRKNYTAIMIDPNNPLDHPHEVNQQDAGRVLARHVGLKPDLRLIGQSGSISIDVLFSVYFRVLPWP
jgi:hypothetical protein